MEITIDERQTVQLFCRAWFQERNLEKTLSFLAEDIKFVGTGIGETAQGKAMMTEYLRQDISEIPEPFHMDFSVIHEQYLAAGIFSQAADLTLINSMYMWHLRFFFTLKCTGGKWQVFCFHAAEPGSSQQGGEHYPQTLVVENVMKQRNDLLNESIAGGMMGGYIEPGFPFYFINRRMLEYLGHGNEAEFVEEIGGLITNCMHPDDRQRIDGEVEQQLACRGEYVVEYRMKRKDGSYIWVHDIGRQMKDESGRPAITSVCIDITAQKKAQDEVMHIYNNVPGAVFRCRYDTCFSIIDANDGFFEFLNYTRKEFEAMGNRFFSVIHPEDVDALRGKLGAGLADGNTINNDNRVICKGGEVKWVSLKAQMLKEETGEQYFYCVFVDITEEKQLQSRVRELYEKELEYFAELSSSEGS
ncbi:PAS domain-containing protein, partial [Faecalicatena contorta]